MQTFAFFLISVIFCFQPQSWAAEVEVSFSKVIELEASPSEVWRALTTEEDLGQWWNPGVILQPKVGGQFYEPWGENQLATGTVLAVLNEKSIKFTWKEKYFQEEQSTHCEFSLQELGGKTVLTVKHGGWESFKDKKQRDDLIQGFKGGWDFFLGKLKVFLEP